jgi:hypothetical protein
MNLISRYNIKSTNLQQKTEKFITKVAYESSYVAIYGWGLTPPSNCVNLSQYDDIRPDSPHVNHHLYTIPVKTSLMKS